MKCTFTDLTSASVAGPSKQITVQLFKVGTDTHIQEGVITNTATTTHDFVLPNVEPTSTGEYNCKVTYGPHGSLTSSNLQV